MIGELDVEHIDTVLLTQQIGRIGCCADNKPYIVPVTYAYQDGYIYGNTNEGMKVRILRSNPNVCFEVDDIDTLEKWRSVIVYGVWEQLHGEMAAQALDILINRLIPFDTSESAMLPESNSENVDSAMNKIKLSSTPGVVYRIKITEKTGRFERH